MSHRVKTFVNCEVPTGNKWPCKLSLKSFKQLPNCSEVIMLSNLLSVIFLFSASSSNLRFFNMDMPAVNIESLS